MLIKAKNIVLFENIPHAAPVFLIYVMLKKGSIISMLSFNFNTLSIIILLIWSITTPIILIIYIIFITLSPKLFYQTNKLL